MELPFVLGPEVVYIGEDPLTREDFQNPIAQRCGTPEEGQRLFYLLYEAPNDEESNQESPSLQAA